MKLHSVLALSVAGALALTGCGDSDSNTDTGSSSKTDAGTNNNNNNNNNNDAGMTTQDMGTTGQDMGTTGQDMGTTGMDMGTTMPDTGVGIIAGKEGEECSPGDTPCETGLDCLNLSGQNTMPADQVLICLRQCMADADCTGVGTTCAGGVCVETVAQEGEIARLSKLGGNALSGCATDLVSLPGGAGLFDLEDDERSCVRPCSAAGTECTDSRFPHCNVGILTSTATPGICTSARRTVGSPCSLRNGTESCSFDSMTEGSMFCIDPFGILDMGPASSGHCVQICSSMDTTCRNAHQPSLTGSCVTGLFTNPDVGLCSDGCSAYPNNCANASCRHMLGSDWMNMGGTQAQLIDNPALSWCLEPTATTLAEWDPASGSAPDSTQNCEGKANQCPAGTYCQGVAQGVGGCVVGCNSTANANPNGCEARTTTTCASLGLLFNQPATQGGICAPPL